MSIVQGLGYSIEGPDAADLLPQPAGDRLRSLRQLRDDARNTLRPITLQINELRTERQGHLARLKQLTDPLGAGGNNLDENATSVKDVKRRIAKLDAELKRLREIEEVRDHRCSETSALVRNLEEYVRRGRPSGTIFEICIGEPPQLMGKENFADAIQACRRRVRVCAADRHAVESAPLPSSVPKTNVREQVARLRSVGQPSVGRMVAFGDAEAEFSTTTQQAQVRLTKELGLAFVEVVDPVALIAWLFPDQLLSALDREVERIADDANALDDATRATKLATIAADMLVAEREEERLISMAERADNQILRRVDADPRATLGIQLVSTASRSSSPMALVSKLIGK